MVRYTSSAQYHTTNNQPRTANPHLALLPRVFTPANSSTPPPIVQTLPTQKSTNTTFLQYAKQQLIDNPDTSPFLPPKRRTRIQKIIGTLIYYGRAVDSTILLCLGSLEFAQVSPPGKPTPSSITSSTNCIRTQTQMFAIMIAA